MHPRHGGSQTRSRPRALWRRCSRAGPESPAVGPLQSRHLFTRGCQAAIQASLLAGLSGSSPSERELLPAESWTPGGLPRTFRKPTSVTASHPFQAPGKAQSTLAMAPPWRRDPGARAGEAERRGRARLTQAWEHPRSASRTRRCPGRPWGQPTSPHAF